MMPVQTPSTQAKLGELCYRAYASESMTDCEHKLTPNY